MMIKKSISAFFVAIVLMACQSPSEKNGETKKGDSAGASAPVIESTRNNQSLLNDFNSLETVFTNDNWLVIDGKDSSYFYVSRLNSFLIKTYTYKIVKGDSAQVEHGTMLPESNQNNNIIWHWKGKDLHLDMAVSSRAKWIDSAAQKSSFEFVRLDKDQISITYPSEKKITIHKTLPFSLFLIRSRYDYLHGTKYAFDNVNFNKK